MIFDSVDNHGEYFSNHYLDVLLQGDLAGLRSRWDAAERRGEDTARTRLRGLARPFFAAKTAVVEGARSGDERLELHDVVLGALGFPAARRDHELQRGGRPFAVPVAHACQTHTGLLLVALELGFAADVDEALDKGGAGRLSQPLVVEDGRTRIRDAADAVSYLFATDEPPRYVLLLVGCVVVLADRTKWAEGRFLAVNLDLALSRADTRAKGELETVAALFSADALVPDEGQSVLDELATASHKHAVGVSKDLREGIRQAVELLANEVIEQRRNTNQAVYSIDGLATRLTRECLRFLYRLLFLLYAEARPELRLLPLDHPEYPSGYGLDRLRDLSLVTLTGDKARHGRHLHESLKLLFRLVNDGYHHEGAQQVLETETLSEQQGLRFEPLRSELFSPAATRLLDSVALRNEVLLQVLRLLLLSEERRGKERGFVSYAQLGINQLGAVYEGLMAYTGFFADQDLYEVARPGQEDRGTWMVPVARAAEYRDDVFVTRPDPDTGQPRRVRHPKGSFVFRLSGRARQRSASYYTPEVLTRCVVKHALAELLDQDGETTPAARLLELTICEPALGSGAFLNEAINQLAAEYLRRRQAERDRVIDPDDYQAELQKAKAHIALHQCYGVDLNETAVELAEVSLWLNAMHEGLRAPWFGLHLRRGNSLVGARRATYHTDQLAKGEWLTAVPRDRGLADGPIGAGEIHHFLLPAHGWGAVADISQAKELKPEATKRLKDWRKAIRRRTPSLKDTARLVALAARIEHLWQVALERLRLAERGLRRPIDVWGASRRPVAGSESRESVEKALRDPESALGRLRLAMDAWCALWFWPLGGPDGPSDPPTMGDWLDTLEALLGKGGVEEAGQLSLLANLDDLAKREQQLTLSFHMRPVGEVRSTHPWLDEVARIAEREGFFHWGLEFAPIFQVGGFDLQLGNPPWVRPTWEDDVTLAEFDPWFGVEDRAPVDEFRRRRAAIVQDPSHLVIYVGEVAAAAGLVEILSSPVVRPALAGIQTNLYTVFMDTVWRHLGPRGTAGLLHPESHFTDPRAGPLRRATYPRLRRHFQFSNAFLLFEDIAPVTYFGVHVYGRARPVSFIQISSLQHPDTINGSMEHDGVGELPSIQFPWGGWDLRPHGARVLTIDERVLTSWARLFNEPGTLAVEARLLRPISQADLAALETLANQPTRLADIDYHWSSGFHEKGAKEQGIIRWETQVPTSWDETILQGPHFTVATPFAKEPNENCRNKQDYSPWNLEMLPERVIPRTNYQRVGDRDTYQAEIDHWEGRPSSSYWRLFWRRMTQPGLERSLHAALMPPGPTHVHTVYSLTGPSWRATAALGAFCSTLLFDYLVKVSGKSDIQDELIRRFPTPLGHPLQNNLLLRVLRLNCLTRDYAPLWEELFDPAWHIDRWTDPASNRPLLGGVGRKWIMATPLRIDYDRRMALVELDALVALVLGLTAEQLCAIYRSQFAVLRKYEYEMWFDANGRRVPGVVVKAWKVDSAADLGRYVLPFSQPDREKEMTRAYEEFKRRLDEGEL
jgi:hypothetical protein